MTGNEKNVNGLGVHSKTKLTNISEQGACQGTDSSGVTTFSGSKSQVTLETKTKANESSDVGTHSNAVLLNNSGGDKGENSKLPIAVGSESSDNNPKFINGSDEDVDIKDEERKFCDVFSDTDETEESSEE